MTRFIDATKVAAVEIPDGSAAPKGFSEYVQSFPEQTHSIRVKISVEYLLLVLKAADFDKNGAVWVEVFGNDFPLVLRSDDKRRAAIISPSIDSDSEDEPRDLIGYRNIPVEDHIIDTMNKILKAKKGDIVPVASNRSVQVIR